MLSTLSPITTRLQKLSDHVYDALCDAIVNGSLAPGARLREAEVADALGVSRTPVREAFARLEQQHLLEKDLSGAYFVARWTKEMLWEVATLRAALEGLAISLASERLEAADFDALEALISQMDAAAERNDYSLLVSLDTEFHVSIWSRCDHRLLQDALEALLPQIRYFVRLTPPLSEYDYSQFHRELVQILRAADPDEQAHAMKHHILIGARHAIEQMETLDTTGSSAG